MNLPILLSSLLLSCTQALAEPPPPDFPPDPPPKVEEEERTDHGNNKKERFFELAMSHAKSASQSVAKLQGDKLAACAFNAKQGPALAALRDRVTASLKKTPKKIRAYMDENLEILAEPMVTGENLACGGAFQAISESLTARILALWTIYGKTKIEVDGEPRALRDALYDARKIPFKAVEACRPVHQAFEDMSENYDKASRWLDFVRADMDHDIARIEGYRNAIDEKKKECETAK